MYSLGINLTEGSGANFRGLNFTNNAAITNLDVSGTNVQFPINTSAEVILEIDGTGMWRYAINGTVEATGTIAGGFDPVSYTHLTLPTICSV